jgi:hypothetical protein
MARRIIVKRPIAVSDRPSNSRAPASQYADVVDRMAIEIEDLSADRDHGWLPLCIRETFAAGTRGTSLA